MREPDEMARIVDLQSRMDADWQSGLVKKGHKSTIVGDERNVLRALRTAPELRGLVRHDEFALRNEFAKAPPWRDAEPGDAWTDDDDTALMAWLQDRGIAVRGKSLVADCVALVAKESRVHPVREYLDALTWDGNERIQWWLEIYLGADDDPDYLAAVGPAFLMSAVARAFEPGCQADSVLVLEGAQGAGKSRTARILAGPPEWFADNIGDLGNKDAAIQLSGKWIIELAELASVRRAEVEAVKSYISRTQDVYRPPYGRRAVTVPRQCVFIGTTNEREYLRDRTGNRRYWPVHCVEIDLGALERDRNQLWAEAVAWYRQGRPWHLTGDTAALACAAQDERVMQTELEAAVHEYLERIAAQGVAEITTREVFKWALNIDPAAHDYADKAVRLGAMVAGAMHSAGWQRVGTQGRGANRRKLYRRAK
jgi:predicted P-loop ATPase